MSRFIPSILLASAAALLMAACNTGGPVRNFTVGDQIVSNDFSEPRSFEEGAYPDATLRIVSGAYRITAPTGDNELWWGQWGDTLGNVVIDVDVNQISERNENAYGIMCRVSGTVGQAVEIDPSMLEDENVDLSAPDSADVEATADADVDAEATDEVDAAEAEATEESDAEDEESEATDEPEATAEAVSGTSLGSGSEEAVAGGDGYLFLIQGNGQYAIMRSRGRNVVPLVNWTRSSAITVGPGQNHLRAVCMDDYLAFYINDQYVAGATDATFQSGQVGLAASGANTLGVEVEFDNLVVAEARPS